MWTVFLCGRTVRARALGDTDRAQPPGPERLQFPPRSRFPPRTRSYLRLYLRACVRHTSTPPVSRLSALAGIARLPVCRRARECLPPACASVVCVTVSAARSLPSHPLEFPRLVRTSAPAVRGVSLLLLSRLPKRIQRTSADVDYHLTVLGPSIWPLEKRIASDFFLNNLPSYFTMYKKKLLTYISVLSINVD